MDFRSFLLILNIGFIAIIFLIHFNFTKKDLAANRMFSVFLFCIGYTSFTLLLFSTKWILEVPHFARTGTLALYLIYPSAYLYCRKLLRQESWKRSDLLHLLPALLYLIDHLPYFMMDADYKRIKLLADYASNNVYITTDSWFFSRYFHFVVRSILSFFYVVLLVGLWVKNFYGDENRVFRQENKYLAQWTLVLTMLLLIGITPSLIAFLFNIQLNLADLLNSSLYFITFCFALFLFFRPEIIYGVKGIWVVAGQDALQEIRQVEKEEQAEIKLPAEEPEGPRKIYLREDVVEMIGKRIDAFLTEEQAFLISGFSISDLSAAVGHPVHQISAYLNSHLGMNFNECINSYRINYLLDKLKENKDWRKYTLEALGQKAGFSNRYTFLNAFKKVTGETPSNYLKTWKNTGG